MVHVLSLPRDPPTERSLGRLPWPALCASSAFAGLCALALGSAWDKQPALAAVNWLVAVVFAITSALLLNEPGQHGNAWLLASSSLFWIVGDIGFAHPFGPLPLLEWVGGPLAFFFIAALLLRFPAPDFDRPLDRVYLAILLSWLLLGRLAWSFFSQPAWLGYPGHAWWPAIYVNRSDERTAALTFNIGAVLLIAIFVILVVQRFRRTRAVDRRLLAPVAAAATAGGLAVTVDLSTWLLPASASWRLASIVAEACALLTIPLAFLVAAVRRRLAQASIAVLVLQVARRGSNFSLHTALRVALCDPQLDLLYWLPEWRAYIDKTGLPVVLEAVPDDRRVVFLRGSDDQPIAAVIMDSSLARHTGLLEAAVSASILSLDNERLQAWALAHSKDIAASQARVLRAALDERRRLEQDLHDGAQQRLLGLTLTLAATQALSTDATARSVMESARGEVHRALEELRQLAHGIHPAVLVRAGLGPALEHVAARLPLVVDVTVPDQRWAPTAESTAYFFACEALTNVVKHAAATRAHITVRSTDDVLLVEVADDGTARPQESGAASPSWALVERVTAVGGSVSVTNNLPIGTSVLAQIPCA